MKKLCCVCFLAMFMAPIFVLSEQVSVWHIVTEDGYELTQICEEPNAGDLYISGDNTQYEIIDVIGNQGIAVNKGMIALPSIEWMDADAALPVSSLQKQIAIYCTHSDESYEPSDGYYTTTDKGTIYQVAAALAQGFERKGITTHVSDRLHHPHDAGAYRRSRQTAVELLKRGLPDCMLDIHRDGIPNPDSYKVSIGGQDVSKIRLLVGRGNQNAALNKEFALTIKAVADRVYPGLIKDIYLGKGTFNQDLLPRSILLECGTYTLEKERVLRSMPMMAEVLNRVLYGAIVGSAGQSTSDIGVKAQATAPITMGAPDSTQNVSKGIGSGLGFLALLLLIGIFGLAIMSTGSIKRGGRKASRNLREMTGGLIGRKPGKDEDPQHS